jgi:hypothetical protein
MGNQQLDNRLALDSEAIAPAPARTWGGHNADVLEVLEGKQSRLFAGSRFVTLVRGGAGALAVATAGQATTAARGWCTRRRNEGLLDRIGYTHGARWRGRHQAGEQRLHDRRAVGQRIRLDHERDVERGRTIRRHGSELAAERVRGMPRVGVDVLPDLRVHEPAQLAQRHRERDDADLLGTAAHDLRQGGLVAVPEEHVTLLLQHVIEDPLDYVKRRRKRH